MFGMGGTEILVILIVALLFLGPDKLPEAAKQISKGIRDIKKQSRVLQRTIEEDEHIGGAIRDLKSALRGEDEPIRPRPIKPQKQLVEPASQGSEIAGTSGTPAAVAAVALAATAQSDAGAAQAAQAAPAAPEHDAGPDAPAGPHPEASSAVEAAAAEKPALTMPPLAGDPDEDAPLASTVSDDAELAAMVKPAPNTIPRQSQSPVAPAAAPSDAPGSKHG